MFIPSKTTCRLLLSAVISLGVLATPTTALADVDRAEAGAIAKKHTKGKVLKITAVKHKKKSAFRVKILKSSGKVVQVLVDAETGKIISGKKKK